MCWIWLERTLLVYFGMMVLLLLHVYGKKEHRALLFAARIYTVLTYFCVCSNHISYIEKNFIKTECSCIKIFKHSMTFKWAFSIIIIYFLWFCYYIFQVIKSLTLNRTLQYKKLGHLITKAQYIQCTLYNSYNEVTLIVVTERSNWRKRDYPHVFVRSLAIQYTTWFSLFLHENITFHLYDTLSPLFKCKNFLVAQFCSTFDQIRYNK